VIDKLVKKVGGIGGEELSWRIERGEGRRGGGM
jgi:hypothetical protein